MTPTPKRAEPLPQAQEAAEPIELLSAAADFVEPSFDEEQWREQSAEERGAGGRQVLGVGLALLGAFWLAYTAWSAGRVLGGQPLSSPQIAQWIAVAAGPLALLGLGWLIFGRTRRKEAERFTRSVDNNANGGAEPRSAARSLVAADQRQSVRTDNDLSAPDAAGR